MKLKFSLVLFALLGFGVFSSMLNEPVFAYDSDPDSLTLSVSDNTLYIGALVPGDFASSNGVDITIDTSNETGYQLSASVGSSTYNTRDLVHSTNPQAKFSSLAITESTAITRAATWGYSTTYGLTYSGLPLYNDEENVLILSSSDEPSYDTVNFRIGAKAASDQATGEYSNIINFLAVTNPIPEPTYPYMQDATAELLNELMPEAGDRATFIDSRSNRLHDIVKLSNGQYFMADNLKVPAGTTLTPDDSNVTSEFTLSTEEWTSGTNYYCKQIMATVDDEYYYNWYAATAHIDNNTVDPSDSYCVYGANNYSVGDICPKGWSLPVTSEINDLANDALVDGFLSRSGDFYDGNVGDRDYAGRWPSSERHNDWNVNYLYWNGSIKISSWMITPYGQTVRCFFRGINSGDIVENPTMQTMDGATLNNMEYGTTISMIDERTGEEYDVLVLSLGGRKTLWMANNLRLPEGTTLSPDDSNVSSSFTLTSEPVSDYNNDYYCKQNMLFLDGVYYYNWYAATANPTLGEPISGTPDEGCADAENDAKSLGDICPKGWRLPEEGILSDYDWRSIAITSGERAGYYAFKWGWTYYVGEWDDWWTSSRDDGDDSVAIGISQSDSFSDGWAKSFTYKDSGYTVRCLFDGE